MAKKKQPVVILPTQDELQPKVTLGGYWASWEEDGVKAVVTLEVISENSTAQGYRMVSGYGSIARPGGTLGRKQQELGSGRCADLRSLFMPALYKAGWQLAGQKDGGDIWKHQSQLAPSREQECVTSIQARVSKAISVPAKQSAAYTRTITAHHVTYACANCGHETTKLHFPGPLPQYCNDCASIVRREKTRARVARLRARTGQPEPTG